MIYPIPFPEKSILFCGGVTGFAGISSRYK